MSRVKFARPSICVGICNVPRVVLTQFSFGHGGTGRVVLHLANGLSERADVHLIVTVRGGVGQQDLESIDVPKVTVHYLLQRKPVSQLLGQIIAVPAVGAKASGASPGCRGRGREQ